jgi:hypothetical protein
VGGGGGVFEPETICSICFILKTLLVKC